MASSASGLGPCLLELTLASNEELTRGRERTRGADLWSGDHVGRSTRIGGQIAQFLVWTLLHRVPLSEFNSSKPLINLIKKDQKML